MPEEKTCQGVNDTAKKLLSMIGKTGKVAFLPNEHPLDNLVYYYNFWPSTLLPADRQIFPKISLLA